MDLWVVAAAAGAGYIAKYWHRLSTNSDSSSQLSSEGPCFEIPEFLRSPFHRQAWRDKLGKDVHAYRTPDGNSSDASPLDGLLTKEKASKSDSEKIRHFRNNRKGNVLSISNLSYAFSPNENLEESEEGVELSCNAVDKYVSVFPNSSAGEVSSTHHFRGNNASLKARHSYGRFIKPLNSLESCLMARLYTEHAKMKEFVFSSVSSPSTAIRPLLLSDGSQIINKRDDDSLSASVGSREYKLHRKDYPEKDENVSGVPPLPKIGPLGNPKKVKLKAGKQWKGRLSSSNNVFGRKYVRTQHDATFIISLGISFGILISIMTNKREINSVRELLKQTDNLVQDLQEELEMKDSLTMKELNIENCVSQYTYDLSFYDKELNGFSLEKHMDNSPRNGCKELYDEKAEENSNSMSKIEAELEAELERLGLNINASSLDRRLSELVVIDPDLSDFAQGELRVGRVKEKYFTHQKSNEDVSDAFTTLPGNYAVSPRELSLRLYEVIQSRLLQRVEELETALQNSQRKVELMESKPEGYYRRDCSSCAQASRFTKGTPVTSENCDPVAQPLVMNLSDEALDAYNEAYEELIKINESEDDSSTGSHDNDQKEHLYHYNLHVLGNEHCGENGSAGNTTYSTFDDISRSSVCGNWLLFQ